MDRKFVEACAKAGAAAVAKRSSPLDDAFADLCARRPEIAREYDAVSLAIDVGCAESILSGRCDNEKVAEPAFVEAGLAEARRLGG